MPYPQLGSPSRYDGSSPFWTLVFVDDVPKGARRKAVASCFSLKKTPGAAGIFVSWSNDDRAEVSLGDAWFASSNVWKQARLAMSEGFDAVHEREPIAAVVFQDQDDMAAAPKDIIRQYATLKSARGKKRRALAMEALSSGEAKLEALALTFVESFVDDAALSIFAARSDADAERVTDAITEVLRQRMFDYDKKPEKFEAVMRAAPERLLDHRAYTYTTYAGVRNLPRIGMFLNAFADERPTLWARMKEQYQASADASALLTLAFFFTEVGDSDGATRCLTEAKSALADKEAKTPLWKVQIPQWVGELERRQAALR